MNWARKQHRHPDQVGWYSGEWRIYEKGDGGSCVLSSGAPTFFGPEHFHTVEQAKERAEHAQRKEG